MGRASPLPDLSGSYRAIRLQARAEAQIALRDLHPRELEVLQLVARGETHYEIGRALGIERATVRSHLMRISDKTHVRGAVNLARLAMRAGLTSLWASSLVRVPTPRAASRPSSDGRASSR